MNTQICQAIASKNVIEFRYKGKWIRLFEPHTYGIHKDTNNEVLSGYQLGGFSESGNLPDWRLFRVSEITSLTITQDKFLSPRPGYNSRDSRMSRIFCTI